MGGGVGNRMPRGQPAGAWNSEEKGREGPVFRGNGENLA